jgi:hypothetical protein
LARSQRDVAGRILRHLVTPSGTKIALTASDLAAYAELDEARVAPVLHELGGGPRILKPTAESRYEIYHDALAAPILDWQARWQEGVKRRRRLRRLVLLAVALLVAAALALVVGSLYFHGSAATKRAESAEADAFLAELNTPAFISPDGTRMLSGGAIWDLATATRTRLLEGLPDDEIRSRDRAAFSPDGALVAIAESDLSQVRLWDAATGAELPAIKGPELVESLAINRDKTRLVTVEYAEGLRIYDLRTQRRIQTTGDTDVSFAFFAPDGKHVVGVRNTGEVTLWDAGSGKKVRRRALRSSN